MTSPIIINMPSCFCGFQVLVTGCNNVNQNILLEYIMINNRLFDSCVRLLSDPTLRQLHGHDVVILLTLLVNYRKNESANPYIVQLSILADELSLNGCAKHCIDWPTLRHKRN